MKLLALSRTRLLTGAIILTAAIQYFIVEVIAQRSWVLVPYSMRINTISDLGATTCFHFPVLQFAVCSPLHTLMNASFIVSGLITIFGLYFIRPAFPKEWSATVAFWMLAIGALGVIGVGLVPENQNPILHVICALILFILSNAALAFLGITLYHRSWRRRYAVFTMVCGVIGFISLILLPLGMLVGVGLMERLVAYPLPIWEVASGLLFLNKRPAPAS